MNIICLRQCRTLKLVLQMTDGFTASVCIYLIDRLAVIFLLTRLFSEPFLCGSHYVLSAHMQTRNIMLGGKNNTVT